MHATQKHRKTHLCAALFSVIFLLLFTLFPSIKASAANKYYTSPALGTTFGYYNSSVTSFSSDSNVTITCSNRGSYSIKVKPNPNTYSRTIYLYAKGGGRTIDTLIITQYGVPTYTINAACTGGNYYNYIANASSFSYSNTAVCSSKSGNYFVVKPNSNTYSRSCKVTVKNAYGTVLGYVNISQAGVPTSTLTSGCAGGLVSYTNASAASFSYSNTAVCNSRSGNHFVVKPNTGTSSRSCTVTVKNSAGNALAYVTIKQDGVPTKSLSAAYTGENLAFVAGGAASYTYSNTAVCNSRSGNNFVVKYNTSENKRSCTVTVKNSNGNIIYYVYINQAGVPLKNIPVAGSASTYNYYNSKATSFSVGNQNMVYNISCSNPGNYYFSISTNPSSANSRTTDVIAKNSSGAYLEILRFTQSKFVVPSKSESYNSDPRTVTFSCPGAVLSKTSYSNSAMFKTGKDLGSGKFQFSIPQNPGSSSRTNKVTFKDKFGSPLAVYTVTQKGVPVEKTYSIAGTATTIAYGNSKAASFIMTDKKMITNVTASNQGSFKFSVSANPSVTSSRTSDIIVKNSSGVYTSILRVTQAKHTHSYTYTAKSSGSDKYLTRRCSVCGDADDCITYQEYLKYLNKSDSEASVKAYMKALGYAESSSESKNMLAAYRYIKKSSNTNSLSKMQKVQGTLQSAKSIADTAAIFANNDKLNKGLTVISAANNAYVFFTTKDTATKFSSGVKLAGDLLGGGLDDFSGGYISSALSTVGDALKDNLPKAMKSMDRTLYAAMLAYDDEHNYYIANISYSSVMTDKNIQTELQDLFDDKFPKYTKDCLKKIQGWKAAYEEQKNITALCLALDPNFKPTIPTNTFWDFANYYVNIK